MDDQIRRFQLLDGTIIEGSTDAELVDAMASEKFVDARSRAGYRRSTARRVATLHEVEVRTDSNEHFIADLIKHGLMIEDEGQELV